MELRIDRSRFQPRPTSHCWELECHDVEAELVAAALAADLEAEDVRGTIGSGITAGRQHVRSAEQVGPWRIGRCLSSTRCRRDVSVADDHEPVWQSKSTVAEEGIGNV